MSKPKNNTVIIATVTGIVALVVGYVLGALIGFGGGGSNNAKADYWVGTYTYDKWNGSQRVSLVLNSDGTCVLPSQENRPCTYEVRDGVAYFNGGTEYKATLGNEGLVYMNSHFPKLK